MPANGILDNRDVVFYGRWQKTIVWRPNPAYCLFLCSSWTRIALIILSDYILKLCKYLYNILGFASCLTKPKVFTIYFFTEI